jgi:hypothetical protein
MVEQWFKFFGRELCVVYVNDPLRDYLAIRNRAYILRRYFGLGLAIRHVRRYALFHGKLRGDWRGHQRYLR